MEAGSFILNLETQTTKFTKDHENQAVPKCFRLIHQVSAQMETIASDFMLFVNLVVFHFPLQAHFEVPPLASADLESNSVRMMSSKDRI